MVITITGIIRSIKIIPKYFGDALCQDGCRRHDMHCPNCYHNDFCPELSGERVCERCGQRIKTKTMRIAQKGVQNEKETIVCNIYGGCYDSGPIDRMRRIRRTDGGQRTAEIPSFHIPDKELQIRRFHHWSARSKHWKIHSSHNLRIRIVRKAPSGQPGITNASMWSWMSRLGSFGGSMFHDGWEVAFNSQAGVAVLSGKLRQVSQLSHTVKRIHISAYKARNIHFFIPGKRKGNFGI